MRPWDYFLDSWQEIFDDWAKGRGDHAHDNYYARLALLQKLAAQTSRRGRALVEAVTYDPTWVTDGTLSMIADCQQESAILYALVRWMRDEVPWLI